MKRVALWLISNLLLTAAAVASEAAVPIPLTAEEIVAKNIAASGGIDAWQKIETMVWVGHIETEHGKESSLPFVLEQKRPYKSRFELKMPNQVGLRVYDGSQGWKLRPGRNGMLEVQPYTQDELSFAKDMQGIDGPLVDYKAKGSVVTLVGKDNVEGHKAYILNVASASGFNYRIWIDAKSFLELKSDRTISNSMGMKGTVYIYYRDYRKTNGVQIPHTIETSAGNGGASDKMVIEKLFINPPLADRRFTRASMPGRDPVPEERGMSRPHRQLGPYNPMMRGRPIILGGEGGQ